MPKRHMPKYRHYKPKNLGVVRLEGKDHYLGRHDSPESWEAYHRLIAEWLSGNGHASADPDQPKYHLTINELILAYWRFAKSGLRHGRTNARETEPVAPVAAQHVEAVLP